jgi:hypothetical protein
MEQLKGEFPRKVLDHIIKPMPPWSRAEMSVRLLLLRLKEDNEVQWAN